MKVLAPLRARPQQAAFDLYFIRHAVILRHMMPLRRSHLVSCPILTQSRLIRNLHRSSRLALLIAYFRHNYHQRHLKDHYGLVLRVQQSPMPSQILPRQTSRNGTS